MQEEVLLALPYIHYFPGQLLSYSRSAGGTGPFRHFANRVPGRGL